MQAVLLPEAARLTQSIPYCYQLLSLLAVDNTHSIL
jgi:hypothetical protein